MKYRPIGRIFVVVLMAAHIWGCGSETAQQADAGEVDVVEYLPDVSLPDAGPHVAHSGITSLYVQMDSADLEELYSRDVRSDEQLPARLMLSPVGPEIDLQGLRFRGSTSRLYSKKVRRAL